MWLFIVYNLRLSDHRCANQQVTLTRFSSDMRTTILPVSWKRIVLIQDFLRTNHNALFLTERKRLDCSALYFNLELNGNLLHRTWRHFHGFPAQTRSVLTDGRGSEGGSHWRRLAIDDGVEKPDPHSLVYGKSLRGTSNTSQHFAIDCMTDLSLDTISLTIILAKFFRTYPN